MVWIKQNQLPITNTVSRYKVKKDQYHSLSSISVPLSKPASKNVHFLIMEWTDLSSLTGGCHWGNSLKRLLMQATTTLPQANFKEFTVLKPNFGCFCWSFSSCYKNNDIFFRKRIGIEAFVQYAQNEAEGRRISYVFLHMQFFLWLKHFQLDSALTQKHLKSFGFDNPSCFDQEKKLPYVYCSLHLS